MKAAALALLLLLAATPAHADAVADLMADHLDCVSQRREHGRELRQCQADAYLASLRPTYAPWVAWGLGVVGAAAAATGIAMMQTSERRTAGVFVAGSGAIGIVAGACAAAW